MQGGYILYNTCIWHHGRGFAHLIATALGLRAAYIQPDKSNEKRLTVDIPLCVNEKTCE